MSKAKFVISEINFHTKFLAVTMNNTLSWNNHIDLLLKKLSKACYIIKNAKTYMSASSLKVIYYAFFHSVMNYGIIFWGNSSHSSIIFRIQKKGNQNCGRMWEQSFMQKFISEITYFAFDITIYVIFINVCSSKQFFF